jgi:hypothetical protein
LLCVQNDEFMFIFSSPEPGGLVVLMQVSSRQLGTPLFHVD